MDLGVEILEERAPGGVDAGLDLLVELELERVERGLDLLRRSAVLVDGSDALF
jgi:hypothetical protein